MAFFLISNEEIIFEDNTYNQFSSYGNEFEFNIIMI